MEFENRIKQHYAVSKNDVLTHINEAYKTTEDYFCPNCGCRMIKRCGKKREWHFAHYPKYQNEEIKECSHESYLHAYSKLRLKHWFEESKSIILHYQQRKVCKHSTNCFWRENRDQCSRLEEKTFDLKTRLTTCSLEETVFVDEDKYRADLLWSDPNNPKNDILIEIKVTHGCTQKKRKSGKQIIEFEVHSEEDVENIIANPIKETDKVRFYGFTTKEEVDETIEPQHQLLKFIYYSSGKTYPRAKCDCRNYRERHKSALFEVTIKNDVYGRNLGEDGLGNLQEFNNAHFFIYGLALAKEKGYDVRDCYFCEHCQYDDEKEEHTCKMNPDKSIKRKSYYAKECYHYSLNEDTYNQKLKKFKKITQNDKVDEYLINM